MENATLDGPVSSPSVISPSSGIYNMDNFTFDVSPSANDVDIDLDLDHSTPTLHIPQSSAAKQPKKRKSWGQELPEPKTTLPPRKRAKTDDEKEQRRIERIKRNRAAAHNSRERKRVEAERLEVENHHLKHKLAQMQQHLQRQHAQLTEFQRLVPNALPQLPQLSSEEFNPMSFDLSDMNDIKDESADTPASTVDTIDPRASLSRSTPDVGTPFIKVESPSTSIAMPTPSATATRAPDDLSQHSAVSVAPVSLTSKQMVGPVHAVPGAHEHHGVLQDATSSYLDAVAGSYGADCGDGLPVEHFFDDSLFQHQVDDLFYLTNDTTDHDDTTTTPANRPFSDLEHTFLTPDLSLSAPPVPDFSAIFNCEGSGTVGS